MKKINILILLLGILGCFACQDWLDVNPKTELKSKDLFSTEDGFKSALTGLYDRMTIDALYGRDLTFLFIEQLVQRYDNKPEATDKDRAKIYDYKNESSSRNKLSSIWSAMYKNIANINNFLQHLETDGFCITTQGYREWMEGEALGLRAFHYFDLLRMWGPGEFEKNKSEKVIPWRDRFTPEKVPLMRADSLAERILDDLTKAEKLLDDDPLNYDIVPEEPFLGYRQHRMNKYAVKALMARVYLWIGEKGKAYEKAKEVVQDCGLSLVRSNQEDVSLFDETLFGLNMFNMKERIKSYFSSTIGRTANSLWDSRDNVESAFEVSSIGINDIRYKEGYGFIFMAQDMICRKYLSASNPLYQEKIPLIRLSEMYYILAETSDLTAGEIWLNTVRNARGISQSHDVSFSNEDIRIEELGKEYNKDFYAEGQYFYFLKRVNQADFRRCPLEDGMTPADYIFPIPDDEIEFGIVR